MQHADQHERRATPRVTFARDVAIQTESHQQFTAVCLDISFGGIGLIASCDISPGEMILFRTELPIGSEVHPFSAQCYVVSRAPDRHPNQFRIGSQFARMPRHDRQALARFFRHFHRSCESLSN